MFLREICSRVRVRQHLPDTFPIKNGLNKRDVLSPLLCNFASEYAIRRALANQESLKLKGPNHFEVRHPRCVKQYKYKVGVQSKHNEKLILLGNMVVQS